jgi:flagellar basal-body rod protein FlgC
MISSAASNALSGLQASAKRLENSANNVANISSSGAVNDDPNTRQAYRPTDVVQISNETGGVRTEIRDRTPATTPVYAPEDSAADAQGFVQAPNVNEAQELIGQKFATYDFKANAKTLEAYNETVETVLNIIT